MAMSTLLLPTWPRGTPMLTQLLLPGDGGGRGQEPALSHAAALAEGQRFAED